MNIFSIIRRFAVITVIAFTSFNVAAEVSPYKTFETNTLRIKISGDGTGVVQGIKCNGCDYNMVKVTKDSKFTDKGVEVGVADVQKRAGKPAMVSFTPSTREVQFIRW